MRKQHEVGPDVEAVMAANPALAWRAGWSLAMSWMSLGFLAAFGLISVLQESGDVGGKVAVSLGLYALFWLAGLVYGGGKAGEGSVEDWEAYRVAFVARGAMWGLGLALVVWLEAGLGEALMTAGLLMGAVLESACVGRIARDRGLSIWKAAMVAWRVAVLGSGTAFGVKKGALGGGGVVRGSREPGGASLRGRAARWANR